MLSALTDDYPDLPEPYNNLAVLYADKGQYEKARLTLEKSLRTHPSYATAHENLGGIYAKMASQAYDRAFQLDRNNTSAHTKLTLIKDIYTHNKSIKTAVTKTSPPVTIAPTHTTSPVFPAPVAAPNTTQPAPVKAATTDVHTATIIQAVREWAAAWSAQDIKRYFAAYAKDFKTPDGESMQKWRATRTSRIQHPAFIQVAIDQPEIDFKDEVHARVTFIQTYRASHLKSVSRKTLLLVHAGKKWLIQEEHSGK